MFSPDLTISQPFTIRDAAVLTTSYVAGNVMSMDAHNAIGLEISITLGSLTSVELKVEVSNDGGNTWAQEVAENTSGGTVSISLAERQFTASGTYSVLITPVRARLVRVSVKGTGTVTGSSCKVVGYPLWV